MRLLGLDSRSSEDVTLAKLESKTIKVFPDLVRLPWQRYFSDRTNL